MKTVLLSALLLLLAGCSAKTVTVNGLVCPADRSDQMVQRDLTECRYYDQDDAARSARPPKLTDECVECLEKRGYEIEQ